MINAQLKPYSYSTYQSTIDAYGQESLVAANGYITMAINVLSQSVNDSVLYNGAEYIGLTTNSSVDDTYVIHLNANTKLKVLYVNRFGNFAQVFMTRLK